MKVYEEEWKAEHGSIRSSEGKLIADFDMSVLARDAATEAARARLAAQAPAMARLLLELLQDYAPTNGEPAQRIRAVLKEAGVTP